MIKKRAVLSDSHMQIQIVQSIKTAAFRDSFCHGQHHADANPLHKLMILYSVSTRKTDRRKVEMQFNLKNKSPSHFIQGTLYMAFNITQTWAKPLHTSSLPSCT
uniref:Ovule protein n=1 Tax=Steinernema glaseri TaxID=37863 RepID=A0A1I7Z251_9BILA